MVSYYEPNFTRPTKSLTDGMKALLSGAKVSTPPIAEPLTPQQQAMNAARQSRLAGVADYANAAANGKAPPVFNGRNVPPGAGVAPEALPRSMRPGVDGLIGKVRAVQNSAPVQAVLKSKWLPGIGGAIGAQSQATNAIDAYRNGESGRAVYDAANAGLYAAGMASPQALSAAAAMDYGQDAYDAFSGGEHLKGGADAANALLYGAGVFHPGGLLGGAAMSAGRALGGGLVDLGYQGAKAIDRALNKNYQDEDQLGAQFDSVNKAHANTPRNGTNEKASDGKGGIPANASVSGVATYSDSDPGVQALLSGGSVRNNRTGSVTQLKSAPGISQQEAQRWRNAYGKMQNALSAEGYARDEQRRQEVRQDNAEWRSRWEREEAARKMNAMGPIAVNRALKKQQLMGGYAPQTQQNASQAVQDFNERMNALQNGDVQRSVALAGAQDSRRRSEAANALLSAQAGKANQEAAGIKGMVDAQSMRQSMAQEYGALNDENDPQGTRRGQIASSMALLAGGGKKDAVQNRKFVTSKDSAGNPVVFSTGTDEAGNPVVQDVTPMTNDKLKAIYADLQKKAKDGKITQEEAEAAYKNAAAQVK